MEINKEYFKNKFSELSGKQLDIELPDTFEELFETQNDPTDFYPNLEWLILTSKCQLKDEKNLDITQLDGYPTYTVNKSSIFLRNVKINGNFHVNGHTYILGNLEVEGVIYGDIYTILAVGGNIVCEGMFLCRTYTFVLGDIMVHQCTLNILYGFLMIKGKLFSPMYIEDRTWKICDIKEDPFLVEKTSPQKVISKYFFEEKESVSFLNQISNILGKENIKIGNDGSWQFDELFTLIANRKKIVKST